MARKFLSGIDLARTALLNAQIQNLAAAPSSPIAGLVYFDTTLGQFGCYTGSAWEYLSTAAVNAITRASASAASGAMVVSAGADRSAGDYAGGAGIVKSAANGVVSAAAAGTDYLAPGGNGSALTGLTQSQISGLAAALALLAPLASPALTGTPTAPTPTTASGIAIKSYVDALVQGISNKYSAVAATTGSETFTIAAGSVTQISGTAVDGQSPAVNDYVLVKDAPAATGTGSAGSSQPGNGLYQVTSNTTNLSLSRAAVMSGGNAPAGAYVFIEGGTANSDAGYVVSTPSTSAAFVYGTGSIAFTQFSGAGEITAGTGLSKAGNTLSIGATVAQKYNSGTIGDGASTTLTVTHNLNNAIPVVQVYDVSGANPVQVFCDVTSTGANTVTLGFGSAPASNSVKCVVTG